MIAKKKVLFILLFGLVIYISTERKHKYLETEHKIYKQRKKLIYLHFLLLFYPQYSLDQEE